MLFCSIAANSWPWIKTSLCQNGTWSEWKRASGVVQVGNWDCFTVQGWLSDRPFYFRVTLDNFSMPDKKTRNAHIKNQEWYEYSGYIEYWIDDEHLDFISNISEDTSLGYFPNEAVIRSAVYGTPRIIKKSKAIIKIAPFKKRPQTYNIWFENIGYAFYCYDE